MIADVAPYRINMTNNVLDHTGQAGIGIAGGVNHTVVGNVVYNNHSWVDVAVGETVILLTPPFHGVQHNDSLAVARPMGAIVSAEIRQHGATGECLWTGDLSACPARVEPTMESTSVAAALGAEAT